MSNGATITGDPLVLGFMLANSRARLTTTDTKEQEDFAERDTAMTGT